nr:NADH dehydrogenase subunit 5 [Darthula hardwickii]
MFNKYMFMCLVMFMYSLVFLYFSFLFMYYDSFFLMEFNLFFMNSFNLVYVIIFDWKSLMFVSVVLFISSMVLVYSSQYMGYNSNSSIRFMYLVVMFIFSMLLMILSPNLMSILLGWDGLGLISYCLVIYYSSVNSGFSGIITCMTNRLGDAGILICLSWMLSYGSWDFMFYNDLYLNNIFYMLVFSSFTKSAQIPFSCWLPFAMAAPTPVSSLVHSSTLVTAGVYLLLRFFYELFIYSDYFLLFGLLTVMFSSLCANYEFDLKSIIALSTLSQLGLMMSSIFMNMFDYSYFHMLSHAMFKSCLFLCAGIYIYFFLDNQDIRMMGNCSIYMPLTTICFNISNLALCGFPFLSGFYSKDMILEEMVFTTLSLYIFIIFYLSLGLTCCYTCRLLYYSVFKFNNFVNYNFMEDNFDFMSFVVFILSSFSVFFSCMFLWMMNLDLYYLFLPFIIKVMSMIFIILGFWIGFELYKFNYFFNINYYYFNGYMWFMFGYSSYLYKLFFNYGILGSKFIYWGEYMLHNLMFNNLFYISDVMQFYLSSNMSVFFFTYIIWVLIII